MTWIKPKTESGILVFSVICFKAWIIFRYKYFTKRSRWQQSIKTWTSWKSATMSHNPPPPKLPTKKKEPRQNWGFFCIKDAILSERSIQSECSQSQPLTFLPKTLCWCRTCLNEYLLPGGMSKPSPRGVFEGIKQFISWPYGGQSNQPVRPKDTNKVRLRWVKPNVKNWKRKHTHSNRTKILQFLPKYIVQVDSYKHMRKNNRSELKEIAYAPQSTTIKANRFPSGQPDFPDVHSSEKVN